MVVRAIYISDLISEIQPLTSLTSNNITQHSPVLQLPDNIPISNVCFPLVSAQAGLHSGWVIAKPVYVAVDQRLGDHSSMIHAFEIVLFVKGQY